MEMTTEKRLPAAILSEMDVLREAADALQEHERLRLLCRQYGDAARVWGVAPHHLAQACKARGLL